MIRPMSPDVEIFAEIAPHRIESFEDMRGRLREVAARIDQSRRSRAEQQIHPGGHVLEHPARDPVNSHAGVRFETFDGRKRYHGSERSCKSKFKCPALDEELHRHSSFVFVIRLQHHPYIPLNHPIQRIASLFAADAELGRFHDDGRAAARPTW